MKILLFADLHENAVLNTWKICLDKRIFGAMNCVFFRKAAHNSALTDKGIAEILRRKPDLAVFPGDAVSTGSPEEFRRVTERLRPLLDSEIPILYTPGNHDRYVKEHACRSAFENFYSLLYRGKRTFSEEPFLYETKEIRFAVCCCARPLNPILSCGYLSPRTLDFLMREAAKNDPRPLVRIGHFPLLENHPIRNYRRALRGFAPVRALLDSRRIALSLCGHDHKHRETLDAAGSGEIIAGSLTRYGDLTEITWDSNEKVFRTEHLVIPRNGSSE